MGDPSTEIDRFHQQVSALEEEIQEAVNRLESESLTAEAEIMRTHLMMLKDPGFHHQVVELVRDTRRGAAAAVEEILKSMAEMLSHAEDSVLAERAADLRDLAIRLSARLSRRRGLDLETVVGGWKGAVLAMPELLPSVVLEARALGVTAFIVEGGTTVSHGAILAKSFGMPVVRVTSLDSVKPFAGRPILVWGGGEILVEPTDAELTTRQPFDEIVPVEPVAGAPQARVWISIVDPEQLESANWKTVEGVGLYRSEALFMRHRQAFPTEQEQFETYRRLFRLAETRPVVFRTADLGADKPVEHMRFASQDNPCLGLRAHRLFRFHPEILVTQVRAVLRAAHGNHRLRLMFPMLESIDQLRFVRHLVDQAVQSLEHDGVPFQRVFRQGVLVETPSAAWSFERFLREVDFASVGTNDLVQYLFAVERNAANVADLYQPEHPVVLQVIYRLAQQAADAGKPLSLCGEMAADTSLLPVLVGLGIRDVSVAPGTAAAVSRCLRTLDEVTCRRLAEQCLQADTVADVRALLGKLTTNGIHIQTIGESEAVDPVCGMVVHTDDTPYRLRVGDVVHYFCSRSCLSHFMSQAEKEDQRAEAKHLKPS